MPRKIPIIILGGADRRPATLPPEGEGKHPLSGCKGVDVRLGDRCLVEVLIERLEGCGGFGPIWIAGPEGPYRRASVSVPVIHTDGSFGENIQAGLEAVLSDCPSGEVAITTCDILPTSDELSELLEDYWRGAPSDLWFPVVRADQDQDLGASDWKPTYRILAEERGDPVRVLPGHLTIFDPRALRLQFIYRFFALAYSTRNRPIGVRRSYILRQILGTLLMQDILHIFGMRLPTLTWDVVVHGLRAANHLRLGKATINELERAVRQMFVRRHHRRQHPERRVRLPLTRSLSLARDIDTVEEAAAIGATAGGAERVV